MGICTKWIIEKDLFHDDVDTIQSACQRNNIPYMIVDYVPFQNEYVYVGGRETSLDDVFNYPGPTMFYGSLNLAAKIRKVGYGYPGDYASLNKYKCTEYYPYIGKYLLNDNYCMIPFSELPRLKSQMFNHFGVNGTIFIRPNDGIKSFTGTTISWFDFDKDLEKLKFYEPNPSDLVVISTPKRIEVEYRLVVAERKIITGSQYKYGGKPVKDKHVPEEAISFASKVVQLYQPDKAFVIDVCSYIDPHYPKNLKYAVVEINSFSCSGFYNCDRDIIVKEISRIAQDDYEEIFGKG